MSTSSVAAKTCCKCGRDLTGEKRMKDSAGLYWCIPCGDHDKAIKLMGSGGSRGAAAGSRSAAYSSGRRFSLPSFSLGSLFASSEFAAEGGKKRLLMMIGLIALLAVVSAVIHFG